MTSSDVIPTLCRALYHQLVKETIIDPHAEEESDAGEIVDHVGALTCLSTPMHSCHAQHNYAVCGISVISRN